MVSVACFRKYSVLTTAHENSCISDAMQVAIGVDVLPVAMLRSRPARAVAEEDASSAVSVSGCFTEHQHCAHMKLQLECCCLV